MDSKLKTQENSYPKTWFPPDEYRHLQLIVTRKCCPLKFNDRQVYSALCYKIQDHKPVTITEVTRLTGLDRQTVTRRLKSLLEARLVAKVTNGYKALPPTDNAREWFVHHPGEWPANLGKYKLLCRGHSAPAEYTPATNGVYSLLLSLADDEGRLIGQTHKGLANLMEIDKNTVKAALKVLHEARLLEKDGSWWRLVRPTQQHFDLWRRLDESPKPDGDRPKTVVVPEPKPSTKEPLKATAHCGRQLVERYRSFPFLAPIDDVGDVSSELEGIAREMADEGFSTAEITRTWEKIFTRFRADPNRLMVFVIGGAWRELWAETLAAHDGKGRSCAGLLALKIADFC